MCSLLLMSLAVPYGYVNCDQEWYCVQYSSTPISYQRIYPNLNMHCLHCNCGTEDSSHSSSSTLLPPSPLSSSAPSTPPLPDLVMTTQKDRLSRHPSSRRRMKLTRSASNKNKANQTETTSYSNTQKENKIYNNFNENIPDFCVDINSSLRSNISTEDEGVKRILALRRQFPSRRTVALSWSPLLSTTTALEASLDLCTNCCSHVTTWPRRCCHIEDEWRKVGRQLRKIANEFDGTLRKNKKSICIWGQVSLLHRWASHCFFVSFVGAIVFRYLARR